MRVSLAALFYVEGANMGKIDAIYARQSVDRADSISVESQLEFCQYEARGGEYKVYTDKGYSGKNTDRPNFKKMMQDIKAGKVNRVIVYKLDRISRSILDFTSMMEEFQGYGVEFVSCTERFDTSSPMGRAMLNICVVFAQLERETIQKRVLDAYAARSKHGFYMGGRVPYGFELEPYRINGKRTSRYKAVPEEVKVVQLIYEMYAEPGTSLADITKYLLDNKIQNRKGEYWDRCNLALLIKNPIYLKADLRIYDFFVKHGATPINDPADFVGTNGCYLYRGEGADRKTVSLEGQTLVIAPHEGIVPSNIWIKARNKCINNKQIAKPSKAKNSWLVGKVKCGKCGYALCVKKSGAKASKYFLCSRHLSAKDCEGVGGIDVRTLESYVLAEMQKFLQGYSASASDKTDPKVTQLQIKEKRVDAEIESLLEKVSQANDTLMNYINNRIEELDKQRGKIQNDICELTQTGIGADADVVNDYLTKWEQLTLDDKRSVVDILISKISATKESVVIEWKK